MKNIDQWKPSKYVFDSGEFRPSMNPKELSPTSYLIAKINGDLYQKYLPIYAKGKLIDLGCGKVPLYQMYKAYIEDATCVDWNNTLHNNPYIDKYCDLTKTLPFDENKFDTVVISDVIEHLPKPENIWTEMHRILKPGGHVILNVPFYYWIHEQPHDYYRYTEYSLNLFAENTGMVVKQLIPIGGPLEIIVDVLSKAYLSESKFKRRVAIGLQKMCVRCSKSKKAIKRRNNWAKKFPLGYFMVVEKIQ